MPSIQSSRDEVIRLEVIIMILCLIILALTAGVRMLSGNSLEDGKGILTTSKLVGLREELHEMEQRREEEVW